ncbi:HEXXH motif domain-containing protein [Streptomyces sp. NPDC056580]|uniref:HEXXH motif domain-containing protein n=1 Tax=Streptomyces sp. NPDC056580 TaxID=3345872 RepID=UPI0036B6AA86
MTDAGTTLSGGRNGAGSGSRPAAGPRHRLRGGHFLQLAQGGGGRDAVAALRSAQRSRRLVLLRALVESADRCVPWHASLPAAQEAWDLLAAAENADREAVESVLLHPSVGGWLARTLRELRAEGEAGPAPSALRDAARVHALAAAAALRARVPFRTAVPLTEHGVVLPALGYVTLPGHPADPVAEVFRDHRGSGVRCSSGTVPLPADLTRDAPGWWALRRLGSPGAEPAGAPLLDDLDPWRHFLRRLPVERLDEDEARDWRRLYAEAWPLVAEQRRIDPEGLADCLLAITPLPDRSPAEVFSGSDPEAFGGLLLTRPAQPVDLAVALVHEAQHSKLSALMDLVTLVRGGREETHYAPWRADPRPLRGMLHGVYAFLGVAAFWFALRERPGLTDAERATADFEGALRRGQVEEGLGTLWARAELTEAGERFLRAVEGSLAAVLKETVPAAAARAAEEARDDHRMVFRLSQLRCDGAQAEAWADAVADGTPAPPAFPGVSLRTGPLTPDVRTRLVRIRVGDRERFDRLRADPGSVGASPADYAWAAGDRAAAQDGYRRLIAENPADPAAWAGLALSLPEGRARGLLLHRPELVAAVHRLLLRRGRPLPPQTLAALIAEAAASGGTPD